MLFVDVQGGPTLMLAWGDGGQMDIRTNGVEVVRGSDALVEYKSNIVANWGPPDPIDGDYGVPQRRPCRTEQDHYFHSPSTPRVSAGRHNEVRSGLAYGSFRNAFSKGSITFLIPV